MKILKLIQALFIVLEKMTPSFAALIARELLFRPSRKKSMKKSYAIEQEGRVVELPSGCFARIIDGGDKIAWFVHGWESKSTRFEKLINDYRERDYTIIAWDGPGHGLSPGNRTNLAHFSQKLLSDLDSFEDKEVVLIGHSFGAAAAAFSAARLENIIKLVLIASPVSTLKVFQRFWEMIAIGEKSSRKFLEYKDKEMNISLEDLSLETSLKKIVSDVLIVHDHKDTIIPISEIKDLKSRFHTQVEFFITQNLGHYKIVSNNQTHNKIISFTEEMAYV